MRREMELWNTEEDLVVRNVDAEFEGEIVHTLSEVYAEFADNIVRNEEALPALTCAHDSAEKDVAHVDIPVAHPSVPQNREDVLLY